MGMRGLMVPGGALCRYSIFALRLEWEDRVSSMAFGWACNTGRGCIYTLHYIGFVSCIARYEHGLE